MCWDLGSATNVAEMFADASGTSVRLETAPQIASTGPWAVHVMWTQTASRIAHATTNAGVGEITHDADRDGIEFRNDCDDSSTTPTALAPRRGLRHLGVPALQANGVRVPAHWVATRRR